MTAKHLNDLILSPVVKKSGVDAKETTLKGRSLGKTDQGWWIKSMLNVITVFQGLANIYGACKVKSY